MSKLHHNGLAISKMVGLSVMMAEYTKEMSFTYQQEPYFVFDDIHMQLLWKQNEDGYSLYLVVSEIRKYRLAMLYQYRIFDYNKESGAVLFNFDSMTEELSELVKGNVRPYNGNGEFADDVTENQRRFKMAELVSQYTHIAGKNMAEKIDA